jgi:hypothetical protein
VVQYTRAGSCVGEGGGGGGGGGEEEEEEDYDDDDDDKATFHILFRGILTALKCFTLLSHE